MRRRFIGDSDLAVSLVGLGCNNFGRRLDLGESRRVIDAAIDMGITLFDTADVYGEDGASERFLGETLGSRRRDVVIATKFGHHTGRTGFLQPVLRRITGEACSGASRRYIVKAVEASLRRLRTDWIDLYQLHTPDPATPLEETLSALDQLVRSGKVRHIGASNLGAAGIALASTLGRELGTSHFVSSQDEYSLLRREAEVALIPTLREMQMSLLPFAPLANGVLSGKYRAGAPSPAGARLTRNAELAARYLRDHDIRLGERLEQYARSHGRSLLELAFSWLAAERSVCSIIAGASTVDQIRLNAKAADWILSDSELADVRAILDDPTI